MLADEIVDGLRQLAAELADAGLGDDDGLGRRLVYLKDVQDILATLVKAALTDLGERGTTQFDVDKVPYRLRQSVSYRWDMDGLFSKLHEIARARKMNEVDLVRSVCSITTARVTALRQYEVDANDYRSAQPGSWRLEGPKGAPVEPDG